jgi:hypothetical protein
MVEMRLATVISTNRVLPNLVTFKASLDISKEIITVVMTSPYMSYPSGNNFPSFGGFFGVPSKNTKIIVKKINNSDYWYYDSSVEVIASEIAEDFGTTLDDITDSKVGSIYSNADAIKAYTHKPYPLVYGITSPQTNALVLSDNLNNLDREIFASLRSKRGQACIHSASTGKSSFQNSQSDGLKVTDINYKGDIGIRSSFLETWGNLKTYTTNGEMTHKVGSAGRRLQIVNQADGSNSANTPTDNDVGSVNIESYKNDVTVTVNVAQNGGRVIIDATGSKGLVCVKAGDGGVEIYSEGSLHLAAEQDININAGSKVNINGEVIHLNPTEGKPPKTTLSNFAKTNSELAEESAGGGT